LAAWETRRLLIGYAMVVTAHLWARDARSEIVNRRANFSAKHGVLVCSFCPQTGH
jgi:hypothetical protein